MTPSTANLEPVNRLAVEALAVRTASGRRLVDIPALDLQPGSSLGISGPSGAGKSTLLYALAGLVPASDGRIQWGATDLAQLKEAPRASFRAKHMGLIFQDFLLFEELDALANAALPGQFRQRTERERLRDNARRHLQRLGIESDARRVVSFSGGERQRVAVARALAGDPPVVLADEPTASLHREAADRLIDDLLALVNETQRTLVIVSHDKRILERLDRVIELNDGRPTQEAGDA
jgi:putative ABC transport system ATP-binding protein